MLISFEMAKMESLLLTNKKFAKQWLKNLKNHENDCPCKLNGYTDIYRASNSIPEIQKEPCPFDLRKYGKSCFSCLFAELLNHRNLKFYHLEYILKNVLEEE